MDRRRCLVLAAALMAMPSAALPVAAAGPVLEVLVKVGPWPTLSRLIGYDGRLWFANSVKGRNHNSADIWSLDPIEGSVRYERYLFSQDAGVPLVYRGLLYWPFEDSRFSLGWGMIEVTDGQNWQPLLVATAEIFHSHSLIAWRGRLLAITSAWRTGLQVSDNRGRDWTALYDHPTPKGRLSRFRYPLVLHDELYGYLEDQDGARLAKFTGGRLISVPGWPKNRRFFALTLHNGRIFAVVRRNDGFQIWQTDGRDSEQISNQLTELRLIDLASDGTRLWAVMADGSGGRLWSSPDGVRWTKHTRFFGGRPLSVHVIVGKVYVAGAGDDGRGIIWGPPAHRIPRTNGSATLPVQFPASGGKIDWQRFGTEFDAALGDKSQYENHGRGRLRALVHDAVKLGAPPGFFAQRLKARLPQGTVQAFGKKLTVKTADIGRSILFWGMGLSKQKDVPIVSIGRPWGAPANSFEKYFDPQLTAIWAVAAAGQKDATTIDSLIERLEVNLDPLWLRAQVIGTLAALTGKRFAYDAGKWRRWWTSARTTWHE